MLDRLHPDRETEISWLHRLGDTAGIALDVGANNGIYALALSRAYREVHAFEPIPHLAQLIDDAQLPNLKVHRCALSAEAGRATLFIPRSAKAAMDGWASLSKPQLANAVAVDEMAVELRTLDSFALTGVSFIKMDVEGHELNALLGARETLTSSRPTLLVEVMETNRAEARALLASLGYTERRLEDIVGVAGSPQNLLFYPR